MGLFLGIFITLFALWASVRLFIFVRRTIFSKNGGGNGRGKMTLETKYYIRGKEITSEDVRQRAKEADEEIRKADLKDKAIKEVSTRAWNAQRGTGDTDDDAVPRIGLKPLSVTGSSSGSGSGSTGSADNRPEFATVIFCQKD